MNITKEYLVRNLDSWCKSVDMNGSLTLWQVPSVHALRNHARHEGKRMRGQEKKNRVRNSMNINVGFKECSQATSIREGDVGFERHAAPRSSIVVTVTMKRRTLTRLTIQSATRFRGIVLRRLSICCVIMSKMWSRIGGRDNYFYCDRCGSYYSNALKNGHPCVENAMHRNFMHQNFISEFYIGIL